VLQLEETGYLVGDKLLMSVAIKLEVMPFAEHKSHCEIRVTLRYNCKFSQSLATDNGFCRQQNYLHFCIRAKAQFTLNFTCLLKCLPFFRNNPNSSLNSRRIHIKTLHTTSNVVTVGVAVQGVPQKNAKPLK
jgi:hypothetical protein